MKNFMRYFAVIALVGLMASSASAQNVSNYNEQGGARAVIGGSLDVISGGDLDIESGGAFKIGGTTMSSTAAELNIMDGVTSTAVELNYNDLTTLGTGAASKALVLDAGEDYTWPATGVLTYGGTGITATGAEVNLLDGTVVGNTVASKVPLLDAAKALQSNANVGTAGTGVTAVEYGDGYNHVTVLTVTTAALTPTTIPADAEGAGVIIYTFPAGVHVFTGCHMDVTAFTGTDYVATNAVDLGIGSLISSGDIATLSTAAMEDCVTGQTVADISSPATEKSTIATAGAPLLFESGDSKVIHLNVAGTWNDAFTAPIITGTVTLYWTFLGA